MSNYLVSEVPYFQTPNDIFLAPISNSAKLIYIYLCRCANNGKVAFPSYQTIANSCSISKSSAIRIVKELIELKYIHKQTRIKKGEQFSNIYKINYNVTELIGSVTMTPPSVTDTPPSVTVKPYKELTINKNLEINKLLLATTLQGVRLDAIDRLENYCIAIYGKELRSSFQYLDSEFDYLDDDFYYFLRDNIDNYDQCNIDYINAISRRLCEWSKADE